MVITIVRLWLRLYRLFFLRQNQRKSIFFVGVDIFTLTILPSGFGRHRPEIYAKTINFRVFRTKSLKSTKFYKIFDVKECSGRFPLELHPSPSRSLKRSPFDKFSCVAWVARILLALVHPINLPQN